MASIRTAFEKEIRTKLTQKATARSSEEQILMKSFKYFDLNNSGDVCFDEFIKAVEKIGVQSFNENELRELFEFYDTDHSDALDYKEFSNIVFGGASGVTRQMTPGKNQGGAPDLDEVQVLLEKLRKTLAGRGSGGIIGLGRQFKIADNNGNRQLDAEEFKYGMRDFGTGFKDDEIAKLFTYFDRTRDGQVNFDEFLYSIRGTMNQFRKNLVLQAFAKIDKDASGELTIDDLVGVYNGKHHPDVKAGKKTEKQVLNEFLDTFHGMYDLNAIHDDVVTKEEFLEYYSFISASIDNDQYFELMMNNAWRINEGANKNWDTKGWGGNDTAPARGKPSDNLQNRLGGGNRGEEQKQNGRGGNDRPQTSAGAGARPGTSAGGRGGNEDNYGSRPQTGARRGNDEDTNGSRPGTSAGGRGGASNNNNNQVSAGRDNRKDSEVKHLVKAFQDKIHARGSRGILGLQRLFKIIDDDDSKELSRQEFAKCVKDFRLEFNPTEVNKLFDYFDENRNGTIHYDEFLHVIRGEINERRLAVIKLAFKKLDRTGDNVITLDDIRGVYNAKNHPDVKAGKKTEDEILCDFLDTFEQYHAVRNDDPKLRNKEVTFEEFTDYYRNVSCSIDNDEYFELMIKTAWNLDNRSYAKGWGGKA